MDTIKITASFNLINGQAHTTKNCKQTINMSEEAYNAIIGTLVGNNRKNREMIKRKIEAHLRDIQYDLRALNFEYTIYDN